MKNTDHRLVPYYYPFYYAHSCSRQIISWLGGLLPFCPTKKQGDVWCCMARNMTISAITFQSQRFTGSPDGESAMEFSEGKPIRTSHSKIKC